MAINRIDSENTVRNIEDNECVKIAIHEAGHALVNYICYKKNLEDNINNDPTNPGGFYPLSATVEMNMFSNGQVCYGQKTFTCSRTIERVTLSHG